ncbi:MAG TPA: sigma-70 family RNA polymerase sigma factor [Blastocatellia bacterium]|nr:sigma-70 family RNA polymerase sigma factor [Blastocatellia bacterium]
MKRIGLIRKSDRALVTIFLRTRDEAAFRELYRRHTPALYPMALRLAGGSEADAQDAVQDTWIRACKRLPGFEWRSSLRTWLTGILINCVRELNHKRYSRTEEELLDEWPQAIDARAGERIDLEQAVDRLPPGYRHVLLLHDVEGYTHEEISGLLEISVGTSKSQLHHARKALRAMFQTEQESQ